MKKITAILAAFVLSANLLFAQSPSFTGPATVANGSTVTFTAVGESQYTYPYNPVYRIIGITSIDGQPNGFTTSPSYYSNFVNVTLQSVPNLYSNSNTPTKFTATVSNPTAATVQITFKVRVNYDVQNQNGITTKTQEAVSVTVNVLPQPPDGTTDSNLGIAPDGTYGGVLTNYLWRLQYKPYNRHFYTIDHDELVSLKNSGQYVFEGAVGYVYKTQQPGSSPLYHYVKVSNGEHYFTADANEGNSLAGSGWNYAGVTGYVPNSTTPNVMPVYHYMAKSGPAGHFWTSNWNELGGGNSSWSYHGTAFYVLKVSQ